MAEELSTEEKGAVLEFLTKKLRDMRRFDNRKAVVGKVIISPCGRFLGKLGDSGKVIKTIAAKAPNNAVLCTEKAVVKKAVEVMAGRVVPRRDGEVMRVPILAVVWAEDLDKKEAVEKVACPFPDVVEAVQWMTKTMK